MKKNTKKNEIKITNIKIEKKNNKNKIKVQLKTK